MSAGNEYRITHSIQAYRTVLVQFRAMLRSLRVTGGWTRVRGHFRFAFLQSRSGSIGNLHVAHGTNGSNLVLEDQEWIVGEARIDVNELLQWGIVLRVFDHAVVIEEKEEFVVGIEPCSAAQLEILNDPELRPVVDLFDAERQSFGVHEGFNITTGQAELYLGCRRAGARRCRRPTTQWIRRRGLQDVNEEA